MPADVPVLAVERRARLAALVAEAGSVSTESLAEQLEVSIETIRRDLLVLDGEGILLRVHGGATAKRSSSFPATEGDFDARSAENLTGKMRIARAAAALVPAGGVTVLDMGTTALLVARELPADLTGTIVTTSLRIASELAARPGLAVLTPGGRVRGDDLSLSGATAVDFVGAINADLALLGSGGLSAAEGLTDYHLDEVAVRQALIGSSRRSFVLADSTKFDRVAPYTVAPLDALAGLVTDQAPRGSLAAALDAAGCQVVSAE